MLYTKVYKLVSFLNGKYRTKKEAMWKKKKFAPKMALKMHLKNVLNKKDVQWYILMFPIFFIFMKNTFGVKKISKNIQIIWFFEEIEKIACFFAFETT